LHRPSRANQYKQHNGGQTHGQTIQQNIRFHAAVT
jgi:hypothetical protein